MDRLTSMAVFVKVVDAGSFAAAAVVLDISAPMVGKHIQFLEKRLGVRLINRTTRRQSLTDFGKIYHERCKVILAEAEASDALALDHLSEPRGTLRVTMPVHFGRHCAAPVLFKLAEQYSSLELDLSFDDRIVDLMEDGYDLAVRTGQLEDRNGRPQQAGDLIHHHAVVYRRSGRFRCGSCLGQDSRRKPSCRQAGYALMISTLLPMPQPPAWVWRGYLSGWFESASILVSWSRYCLMSQGSSTTSMPSGTTDLVCH